MQKFEPELFFVVQSDVISGDIVGPTIEGAKLIAQYINSKYHANICCPVEEDTPIVSSSTEAVITPTQHFIKVPFFGVSPQFNSLISEAKTKSGDYRQAFIFSDSKRVKHVAFVAYIREGNNEGILYSDSLGSNRISANLIHKITETKVFYNYLGRQAADIGCITDALVFGRDITRMNPETGQYIIQNLLGLLEGREEKVADGLSLVKLPNELLKTAQTSKFIDFNKDMNKLQEKIHKDETIDEFRDRYSKDISTHDGSTKRISTYLHTKGNKYRDIMEIQFYLNEIEKEIGHSLPDNIKKDFISDAKTAIKVKELHIFSERFLNKLSEYNDSSLPIVEVIVPPSHETERKNLRSELLSKHVAVCKDAQSSIKEEFDDLKRQESELTHFQKSPVSKQN